MCSPDSPPAAHSHLFPARRRSHVDVDHGGGLFGSPLHVACVNFDPGMVALLLKGKADVNVTDNDGNAPFHVFILLSTHL